MAHDAVPFLGLWLATTAAMMLPSAVPFTRVLVRSGVAQSPLVASYLGVWLLYGVAALGVMRALPLDVPPAATGLALAAAGAYQLTPLKHACLRRCRSPLSFLVRRSSGLAIGLEYGAFCVGCCSGIMLALLVVGMSSLVWMAVAGVLVAAEKLLPSGTRVAVVSGLALAVAGAWVAA